MSKTLAFQWVSFINDSEDYAGGHASDKLATGYVHTKTDLPHLSEAVKAVERFEDMEVTVKDYYGRVFVSKATAPLQLETYLDVGSQRNLYTISGKAPSLQWLLAHSGEVNSSGLSKIYYPGNSAVQFVSQDDDKGSVMIRVLNLEGIRDFVSKIQGTHISWLSNSFDGFLDSYGYRDKGTRREMACSIIMYQAASILGFKDPKDIIRSFGDKRVIADLAMRGVFEVIGKY